MEPLIISDTNLIDSNINTVSDDVLESIAFNVKPSKIKNAKKYYFTKETEEAILEYNKTTDSYERNRIYEAHIKYPFNKLAENIINTFKFEYIDVPYNDIHHEVVAFLNEKIHRYTDPKLGKAFSYFSIVAKNYLIIRNNINYDRIKNTDQPEAIDDNRNVVNEVLREEELAEKKEFVDLFVDFMDENMTVIFKRQTDINVADSILELFRNRENIEDFNKKALYILIRDRSGVKTQYITSVMKTFKEIYADMYYNYKHTGMISLNLSKFKKSEFLE